MRFAPHPASMPTGCTGLGRDEARKGTGRLMLCPDLSPQRLSFSSELEFSAFVFPQQLGLCRLPLAFPSQGGTAFGGRGLAVRAEMGWEPLLLPILLPLGTLSAKNKLSENHIFLG